MIDGIDIKIIRDHIDGYAFEMDQNKCCSESERAEVEADREAAHSALDELIRAAGLDIP